MRKRFENALAGAIGALFVLALVAMASFALAQTPNGIRGAFAGPVQVISPHTLSLPAASFTSLGTAVAAGTCQAQTAVTVQGVTTTSVVANWTVATALAVTWQTGIDVKFAVSANTVQPYVCNATAGSITPVATLVQFRTVN